MKIILKTIVISALVGSIATGSTLSAQAGQDWGNSWGGTSIHSDVFKGD
ncbi:MAG: hypothetical protein RIC14_00260 [Filomicrobium sp.]